MKTTRLLVLTLVLALCGAIAAGCGSSSGSGGSDDPAALIPAGAPVYVEGVLHPDGKVRSDLEGALKKILRTDDPGAKITATAQRQRQGREGHLQGRRRAVARRPLRRRGHRAAQRPRRRLRRRHRLHGRRQGRADAGQADGRHRQALLQGRRLPLRPQGQDRDGDRRSPRRRRHRGRPQGRRRCQGRRHAGRVQRPERRALQGRPGPHRALLPRRPGPAAHRSRRPASSDPQVGAMLQSFSSAAPKTIGAALQAQPDALRIDAVSIGHAEVGDDAAAAAPTSSPRCPATRGWAWASPTSARPSTASCRRWPAAAGSPASASTPCSASSRSRPASTCARTCSAGWATPACSSAARRAPTSAGRS